MKKKKIENKGMMDGKVASLRNEDEKRIKNGKKEERGKRRKERRKVRNLEEHSEGIKN